MKLFNSFSKPKRTYLDYASTTPLATEVQKKMREIDEQFFANPSALYTEALLSKQVVASSREKIASFINAQKNDIVFTSGGTEANNLAILGTFNFYKKDGFIPHFITSNIEHPAILEVCKEIERRGGEVTYIAVSSEGLVSPRDIAAAIKDNTVLVSVMYANNEIGTIQNIKEIGKAVKERRTKNNTDFPCFHTDACQAGLYLSLDVIKQNIDLMTLDGIKMYGPRGLGILYVKSLVALAPVNFGGRQEKGLRSGTENVAGIVGFAIALEIAEKQKEKEVERLKSIRDYGMEEIAKAFPTSHLNGSKENRLPNNINICFPGLDAEFAVISLDVLGISASYSSSCLTLKEDSTSYVVESLGKKDCSGSSLRFTLGRESTRADIDTLVAALKKIVK